MMPMWGEVLIVLAALMAVGGAWWASRSKALVIALLAFGVLHVALTAKGFYLDTTSLPPRPMFVLGPPLLAIAVMVFTGRGRAWAGGLDLLALTALQTMRLPVEIVLQRAGMEGQVPTMVTWAGTNFDVITGITAPVMAAYLWRSANPDRRLLIAWNIICLGLALNVVGTAVLSIPGALQQLNFDHPNLLVLTVPYVLLPAVIVPVAFWAHAASLVKLLRSGARRA